MALDVLPKRRVLKHRSLEVSISKPATAAHQQVQQKTTASDPFAEIYKKKVEWVESATVEKSSEKKGEEEGPSDEPSTKDKEITEGSGVVKGKGIAEAT